VHLKHKIGPIESEFEYTGIDKRSLKKSVRRAKTGYDSRYQPSKRLDGRILKLSHF